MTQKQREKDSEEKERKKEEKKDAILKKIIAAKRVRAALEYQRARKILPPGTLIPFLEPEPLEQAQMTLPINSSKKSRSKRIRDEETEDNPASAKNTNKAQNYQKAKKSARKPQVTPNPGKKTR